jgi:hypothetical protein
MRGHVGARVLRRLLWMVVGPTQSLWTQMSGKKIMDLDEKWRKF